MKIFNFSQCRFSSERRSAPRPPRRGARETLARTTVASGPGLVVATIFSIFLLFLAAEVLAESAENAETSRSSFGGSTPPELFRLRNLKGSGAADDESIASGLRDRVQREAALGAAIQAGARHRYSRILAEVVEPRSTELDEIFDFSPFLTRRGALIVVPPVASASGEAFRLRGPGEAGSRRGGFVLARPAFFASLAPHWRHYLGDSPVGPEEIHPALRPRGVAERAKWREWIDEGWRLGTARAEELFAENAARLARDLSGMARFGRLTRRRLARGPEVGSSVIELDVKDGEIIFDETTHLLTEDGRFVSPAEADAGEGDDERDP